MGHWSREECQRLQAQLVFMYADFKGHGVDVKNLVWCISKPEVCSREDMYDVLDQCLGDVDRHHREKVDAIMAHRAAYENSENSMLASVAAQTLAVARATRPQNSADFPD